MRIGKWFMIEELFRTPEALEYRIRNFPAGLTELRNLKFLVDKVLDPLRDHLGVPIRIISGYRCKELAQHMAEPTSDHITGCAVDIKVPGYGAEELIQKVLDARLDFDQAIPNTATGSLHISYRVGQNRAQIITEPDGEKPKSRKARGGHPNKSGSRKVKD